MAPKRAAKRKVKKQRGKGIGEVLSKINKIAKDTKIVTSVLNTLAPESGIAQTVSGMADQLGYGRKKKRQRGKGFSDIIGSILGGVGGGIGKGVNATLGGLFGGSRVQAYSVNPMMIR
jgi:hypothetical protein